MAISTYFFYAIFFWGGNKSEQLNLGSSILSGTRFTACSKMAHELDDAGVGVGGVVSIVCIGIAADEDEGEGTAEIMASQ